MPTLLCFGDSNTHGSPPIVTRGEAYARFDAAHPLAAGRGRAPARLGGGGGGAARAGPRSSPTR